MLGLMSFSSAERAKMVALFHKLGPDAPTLCEGWTTRDLAVHLWVRENRPDAAAGIFVKALSGRLEKESRKVAERDFAELVDDWGRGPAAYNPVRFVDAQQTLWSTLFTTKIFAGLTAWAHATFRHASSSRCIAT